MEAVTANTGPITYRQVFRNGTWIRLWAGQTISQLGDFVSDVAFPLLVYDLTRSPIGLGLGFAVETLPIIVIGPVAGVWADRVNRRSLLLVGDAVRTFCALGLFFATQVWELYALALVAAIMQAIFTPAYSAVIPQITREQFSKSISLSYTGFRAMQVIGPAVAAGLIALAHGPRPVFVFDSATFAIAALMTLTVRVGDVSRAAPKSLLDDLSLGGRFLLRTPVVRYLASYNCLMTIATAAATLGTVVYIKEALGLQAAASDQLYGVTGAMLAGSLALVTWLIGMFDSQLPTRVMILGGPLLAGMAYLLFILHPGGLAVLAIFVLVGAGSACSLVPVLALLAKAVPNELRGRVYSFFNAMDASSMLVAYGIFGAVGTLLPDQGLLIVAGAILLLGVPTCTWLLRGSHALAEATR